MKDTNNTKLTYESLPEQIKRIGNESLGPGVLKSLFSYGNTYHLLIKISDGAFIGFSLYYFNTIQLSKDRNYTIGHIAAVCVAPPYRKEGFGTLLTYSTLRKMAAYGADRVEIMLKTPPEFDRDDAPNVPLIGNPELLEDLGFRHQKTFKNYYTDISIRYDYDCILCNTKPDACEGNLYAINDTIE